MSIIDKLLFRLKTTCKHPTYQIPLPLAMNHDIRRSR